MNVCKMSKCSKAPIQYYNYCKNFLIKLSESVSHVSGGSMFSIDFG